MFSNLGRYEFSFETQTDHLPKIRITSRCGPRYMRSFYVRIRVCAIENWRFLRNLSPNL